ncbi:hypothetical protein [Olleya sp. Bg11-27]|uniref:hypothetical protein n=1 Tax=Olleya sp. Bg11-27 TaxID=2058135 RepID=UPI000C3116D1|nr:hypothetical protein [Olleya sp. Bg11-27]AUC76418.1 hypothetical protein CW732_12370 [Olleya sp. Bg11-27]
MDGELSTIILVVTTIILIILKITDAYQVKSSNKQRLKLISKLKSVPIVLDTIKIDGLHWTENRPVDVYDNQLDPNQSSFYNDTGISGYHKQKDIAKFESKLIIPITYMGQTYNFKTTLPLEHTIVRMKFYVKKTMPIYIVNTPPHSVQFLIDLTFMDTPMLSVITTPYFTKKNSQI